MLEFASVKRAVTVSIDALLRTVVILVAACLPNWLSAQTKDDPEPPPPAAVLAGPPPSACPGDPSKLSQPIKILSDTMGVDFEAYLSRVVKTVRQNWYSVIPETAKSKHGKAVIQFAIMPNGSVSGMALRGSSNDVSLDRAAWGAITSSTPFPLLPSQFKGPYLALCFSFLYNPTKPIDTFSSSGNSAMSGDHPNADAGLAISPPSTQVPAGSSQQFSVDNGPVTWEIVGDQCAKSDCGSISTTGLYKAPAKPPQPPAIAIKATQTAAPFKSAFAPVALTPQDQSK
jgi:TonB family protein